VGNILRRNGIPPAPERKYTTTWKEFIRAHMAVLAGTDFFTVEVLTLRGLVTYYVLFFTATRSRMFYYWTICHRMWKIQSWCGVTCSRTEGALLATAGFQALGKSTPMSGTSVCALGNDRYGQCK